MQPQRAAARARTGSEQQLSPLERGLGVEGGIRAVQADHAALAPLKQPGMDNPVVDYMGEPDGRVAGRAARRCP